jgi:hypothetical protein
MIACSEHVLARHATQSYLEEEKSFRNYFTALHYWEQFLAAAWHSLHTLRYVTGDKVFEEGDGSIEERLPRSATGHTSLRIH